MKYFEVGKIVGTHGIKGELKVKSETDFSAIRYAKNNHLYIQKANEMIQVEITSHRVHKGLDLITLLGYHNINQVLEYVGLSLFVDQESLHDLEEDEFYIDDLIGLEVLLETKEKIGVIADVRIVPQGEIIVVQKTDGTEKLVPFVKEFFGEIALEENYIIITPIEGLL